MLASLDSNSREVRWVLTTLDAATGQVPTGVDDGFLPVENGTGRGQGWMTYTVDPVAGAATGTAVTAQAGIVFDQNAAIDTEPWTNTLDDVIHVEPDAEDNTARSIAWAHLALPTTGAGALAPVVLLGRDDLFADSLASGGAQGALDAPLLLTGGDAVDPRVHTELERLGAERVVLLGGRAALSDDLEQELVGSGFTVERVSGPSRIETAVAVAAAFSSDAVSAVLARAYPSADAGDPTQAFADALADGSLAAERGIPVLLTQTDRLNESTRTYLADAAITQLVVVGGTAAVSNAVLTDLQALGITVDRVAGPTRFATATAIAAERGAATAADAAGTVLLDGQHADAWADAFPAALYAGRSAIPVVLSTGTVLPDPTTAYLPSRRTGLVCASTLTPATCATAADLHD